MANSFQRASLRRKVLYAGLIVALFTVSIFWRGKLDTPFARQVAASEAVSRWSVLNQAVRLDLREVDQGDPEVAASTAQVALVGVRGVVVTGLWWTAIEKQKRNEFQEFELLVRVVTQLQPNFITPWIFQGWNIAYNVSVENDKLGDMYFYIARGIDLLAEGDRRNTKVYTDPNDGKGYRIGSPDLRYQIGFFYQNKFGVSDKVSTLRSLAQVSCIPPGERKEEALTVEDAATGQRVVNPEAFKAFCLKNPQLVRRLRTKLNCATPQDVVRFLKDNDKIPTLYKNDQDFADPAARFPALPPDFPEGPDEYSTDRRPPADDSFDPFLAARAWYTYAQAVVPPPKTDGYGDPIPWAGMRPVEDYDPFRYRVPRSPALIIFRQYPPRAQTYLADRLSKEGWFDGATAWNPDEGDPSSPWFPGGGVALRAVPAGVGSKTEWAKAWELWDQYGRDNAMILSPEKRAQLQDTAGFAGAPSGLPPDLPPDELEARGLTPKKIEAWKAIVYYDQNRSMTNFAFFFEQARAEKDQLTVDARKLLAAADDARRAGRDERASRLYPEALARWREALAKYPQFHRSDRSESTEEATLEVELEYVRLLREDGAVRARADRAADAARVLFPALGDLARADYLQAAAEDEADARVTVESVLRVFPRLPAPPTAPEKAVVARVQAATEDAIGGLAGGAARSAAAADALRPAVARRVVDTEFAWMKEFMYEPKARGPGGWYEAAAYWVSPQVRDAVKSRIGLVRKAAPTGPPAEATGGAVPQALSEPK